MKPIVSFAKKHPILSFYALTFTISWGLVLVLIAKNGMPATMSQLNAQLPVAILAMLGGPSISGLLMTAIVDGKTGFYELRSRLLKWRVNFGWYILAILIGPAVLIIAPLVIWLTLPNYSPGKFVTEVTTSLIVMGVVSGLVTGFCEELGWTGFVLPKLRLSYGILTTGLIMGVLWGAWHILSNDIWAIHTYSGTLSPALKAILIGLSFLIGQLPAFRVLLVWVYDRTGSMPVIMIMHAGLSAASIIIGSLAMSDTTSAFLYGLFLPGVIFWIIIAVFVAVNGWKLPDKKRGQAII